ncbi:hypothetical protein ASPZODRAFT_72378 [Penicilliopsis zonata CBS 506.65]|uniref:EDC4-like protein pdc1 beta-propeller domain-containing protein n=1 Tax=Penicilliopsis zonata CBS 506.65 TaxID=1073090 RepID=A0A1L9SAE1_9EURO|nr:hypothetical protein ASPZODRAFT_72378 [Penicilliopsis zonata CBS 506.65]OJJ44143.1 hypothetical protein ASPZODRAFT_72378 [Penicilliopsis zonata CBS 506.65]
MSTTNDLQALLASIRPRPSPSSTPGPDGHSPVPQYPPQYHHQQAGYQPQPYDGQSFPHPQRHQHQQHQQHGYHQPSVSSIAQSPSPQISSPPHHGSDILSPNVPSPHPFQPATSNPDRAASLLSLLRFSQAAAPSRQQVPVTDFSSPMPPPPQETGLEEAANHRSKSISASDLVASLLGGQALAIPAAVDFSGSLPAAIQPRQPEPVGVAEAAAAVPTADNTQEFLLRLLNRPKPSPEPQLSATNLPEAEKVAETTPSATPKESLFTYVNPFEQLAAASPRTKTPQSKPQTAISPVELAADANARAHLTVKTPETTDSEDKGVNEESESQIFEEQKELVSEIFEEAVDDDTDREVGDFVEKASSQESSPEARVEETAAAVAIEHVAEEIKKEPASEEVKQVLQEATTAVASEATVKDVQNESGDALADSWESAEDSAEKDEERVVPVLNFPLRPFISIAVQPAVGKIISIRDDGIMDIARLKKDFDQLDRSLTSATSEYIVYALAKNGGIRIIRQDDGSDKQIFRATRDRVFNVALCTSPSVAGVSKEQAVLGIGVSGTVYWAMISRADQDLFELDALESESLTFPPFPASDENTSGGQLKTRAKRSSRHPEFFAIGRGKNIYVISPQAATVPGYEVAGPQRTVATEKFFRERALKISTGKAGKDFAFSDDDTVIASLDKTGRLRFWDIREIITKPDFFLNPLTTPTEIRVPLNTFITGSPAEKSWPTSVLFIDKLRPYVKSMALRYVLVGLKQNHTLQLWDIGLGKAVQELKFPHENESDAICSVAYHPSSGIIVVGHPTRNTIYFVHLSAPRYNLQPMTQASYIKRAAEKDSSLPKPESTACMSGIREISFASKGQLRSLDLLPINKTPGEKRTVEDETGLFELYVMHSRGVTCLNIKKEDLGWSADNKIIRPVNALEDGLIEITDLQTFPSYVTDEPSVNGDSASTPQKVTPTPKEFTMKPSELETPSGVTPSRTQSPTKLAVKKKLAEEQADVPTTPAPAAEKPEKKKKKKGTAAASESAAGKVKELTSIVGALPTELPSEPRAASTTTPKAMPDMPTEQTNGNGILPTATVMEAAQPSSASAQSIIPGATWNKHLEDLQAGVSSEFNKSLGREFEGLYRRFDEERRAWDAASAAKQDQVLRLVSSTLSDNVEKNLARIVSTSIESEVLPAISDSVVASVGKQVKEVTSQQLGKVVSHELQQILPETVSRAVQQPEVAKAIADSLTQRLVTHVGDEVSKALHATVTPAFKSLALRATEKIGSDIERQLQVQMKHYEIQRHNDSLKIDQLTNLVRGLSDTVASMAAAQTGFQNEVLRLNRLVASRQPEENNHNSLSQQQQQQHVLGNAPQETLPARSPEEVELAEIVQLMNEGRFEEGSVKWLQSSQQADLFDNFFVRLNPTYLTSLSPIVALSVGVAVTTSLVTNISERLAWLEVVLQTVNVMDPDLREVAPKIMDILIQRLESLYMTIAENTPHDPVLRKIPPLSRRARELRGTQ